MEFSRSEIRRALERSATGDGLRKYLWIMEKLPQVDVTTDKDFQRTYNDFYAVQSRSQEWYETYFEFMQRNKTNDSITFEQILRHLWEKAKSKNKNGVETERVEASFSSKLLASITPQLPIWDANILRNTGITPPDYGRKEKQFQETLETYTCLIEWYAAYRVTGNARFMLDAFDKLYPEGREITDVKKIDFVLWQMRG